VTIRRLCDSLLDEEPPDPAAPLLAIIAALAVVRTLVQGARETATNEGIAASLMVWKDRYGETDATSVRRWLDELGTLADLYIPPDFIEKVIKAD
jgi:hypothetical protein